MDYKFLSLILSGMLGISVVVGSVNCHKLSVELQESTLKYETQIKDLSKQYRSLQYDFGAAIEEIKELRNPIFTFEVVYILESGHSVVRYSSRAYNIEEFFSDFKTLVNDPASIIGWNYSYMDDQGYVKESKIVKIQVRKQEK